MMNSKVAPAPSTFSNRRIGRSVLAIAAAFFGNAVLALATDQLFHVLGVYPPWGQPMFEAAPNAIALSYRLVYGVGAGWLVARLAPQAPMRHVSILGIIATVLSGIAAVVTVTSVKLGPSWYPIALALSAYPTVWLGGALEGRGRARTA